MVKAAKLRIDSKSVQEGEWIRVGDEWEDLEIWTRGFTDAYTDARNRALQRAAKSLGDQISKVPVAIVRRITVEMMIEHCILGVRNLTGDDGEEITLDQFRAMLRQQDWVKLLNAAIAAANLVGEQRADDLDTAVGNLPPPSATPSPPITTDT